MYIKNLVFFFSSIFISIIVVDIFLNISTILLPKYERYKIDSLYFKSTGIKFARHSKQEEIAILKKNGKVVFPTYIPGQFLDKENKIFPLSGLSNKLSVFCNENGYYSKFKSDRYGFNNPDLEWNNNEIAFTLIGDSFIHGSCVNRPDDISSQIRKLTNGAVINLGQGSTSTLVQYAIFREFLPKKTKKLLWFFYEGNDIKDLSTEFSNKILSNYFYNENFNQNIKKNKKLFDIKVMDLINEKHKKQTQQIDNLQTKKNENIKNKNEKHNKDNQQLDNLQTKKIENVKNKVDDIIKNNSQLYKLIRKVNLNYEKSIERPDKYIQNYKLYASILKKVKKILDESGTELILIYLPEYSRYKNFFYNDNELKKIKKIALDLNIKFLDINEKVFLKQKDPLLLFPFRKGGHYTPQGYKLIANYIFHNVK